MFGPEVLPIQRVRPVGFWPFYLGTFRDHSGYGNHGTVGGAGLYRNQTFGRDQLISSGVGSVIVPNSPSLEAVTDSTLFVSGLFNNTTQSMRLFNKRDVGGCQYELAFEVGALQIYDGTAFVGCFTPIGGSRSLCITAPSGAAAGVYLDGTYTAPFLAPNTYVGDDCDLTLFNLYTGTQPYLNRTDLLLWYPSVLTPAEISDLHLWSQSRFTPRKQWPGSGLRYPGRETNLLADPTDPANWTPETAGTITRIEDGIRIARDALNSPWYSQTVLTPGRQHRMKLEARSDGATTPQVFAGLGGPSWVGTTSTDWQPVDELVTAIWGFVGCQCVTAVPGYAEFRNVKVWTNPPGYTPATGDPLFLDNIQTARVSVGNET